MSPQPVHSKDALAARLHARISREWTWTTAVLLVLTFFLGYFSPTLGVQRLENTLYDRLSSAFVQHAPSDQIVIIAIDDSSIDELGFWPWRRSLHAQLLEKLGGARAIGIDLLLSEQNPAYPEDDGVLANSLQHAGQVVLPLAVNINRQTTTLPRPLLLTAAAGSGFINISADSDGIIRSFSPKKKLHNGQVFDHLSLALLANSQHAGNVLPADHDPFQALRIVWAGAPGSFTTVPYSRVLDNSLPPSLFDDKYVLIGAWASGLGDTFQTPQSLGGEPMAGVEILANILNDGLTNTWVRTPTRLTGALLCLFPVLASCLALRYFSPQRGFLLSNIILLATFLLSGTMLAWALWWVSPVPAIIGVVLTYPVWSWRSQHAALRHIDAELALLDTERQINTGRLHPRVPTRLRRWPALLDAVRNNTSLVTRIGQLHHAIDQIRIGRRQRDETLRFLSHDMRAPLNSTLAMTELQRHQPDQVLTTDVLAQFDHYARKTLTLVDGFVELTRAEEVRLSPSRVNLAELITHCCEDAWVTAYHKRIVIDYSTLPDAAWVMADAPLFARAWSNLIDNAIKYSGPDTRVTCSLVRDGDDWIASIQDQGRGMAPEAAAQAFAPFIRIDETHADNPGGAGLGLAFVRVVVSRHDAHIQVTSKPGQGTKFRIRLAAATPPEH